MRYFAIAYLLLGLVCCLAMVCALLVNNRYWVIIFGAKTLIFVFLALRCDGMRTDVTSQDAA